LGAGGVIKEVPIPTFYGDEICHVNGMKYALQCMKNVMQYRTMQAELFYDPRFDLPKPQEIKSISKKSAITTIDFFVENTLFSTSSRILKIASDSSNSTASGFDKPVSFLKTIANLESDELTSMNFDVVIALDALQNQSYPEATLKILGDALKANGQLYASCANVAYFPVRLMLLFGFFNYGRKGVLDRSHKRLFTRNSFKRLLLQGGFEIEVTCGFGPPIIDKVGTNIVLRALDKLSYFLAKLWPSLFAFEILFIAKNLQFFPFYYLI
jgi:hypothetical protein